MDTLADSLQAIARRFKVSVLVAARRTLHLRLIDWTEFREFYESYRQQAARTLDEATGGNFWNSQNVRIGRRFGAAVTRAVKEGRLSYREGVYSHRTARRHVRHLHALVGSDDVTATAFALDANVFIEAHRRYYGLDLCPASGIVSVTMVSANVC